jgi:hypothetical protein
MKIQHTTLACTFNIPRAAHVQVNFSNVKAVGGFHHGVEPCFAFLRNLASAH